MATLYKRGAIYWIAYKENGKRQQISSKQTDHATARRLLKHYEAIEKASALAGTPLARMRLSDWKQQYLRQRQGRVAPGTLKKDGNAIDSLLTHVPGHKQLDSISPQALQDWYSDSLERGRIATANSHLRHLKAFFNAAIAAGYLQKNPVKSIRPARDNKNIRPHLSQEQARILLNYLEANAPAWAELVRAALYIGARAGELCRLTAADIDLELEQVIIQSTAENPTKARRARRVPIPAHGLEWFAELCKQRPQGHLLLNPSGDAWRVDWIAHGFVRIAKKAGLDGFTFHDLRRTYGAWLVMAGADLVTVKDNLGHSSINITIEHYAHIMIEHRATQTNRLPKL